MLENSMQTMSYQGRSLDDTDRLGKALLEEMPPSVVIALAGTLGAGKTRLVQAIATACEIDQEEVTSPTYVLCHQYEGRRTIYHFDAYRLADEDEFLDLGADEIFESQAIVLVEWADRVGRAIPADAWRIEIEVGTANERLFQITAPAPVIRCLQRSLQEN